MVLSEIGRSDRGKVDGSNEEEWTVSVVSGRSQTPKSRRSKSKKVAVIVIMDDISENGRSF